MEMLHLGVLMILTYSNYFTTSYLWMLFFLYFLNTKMQMF